MENREALKTIIPILKTAYQNQDHKTFKSHLDEFKKNMQPEIGYELTDKQCVLIIARTTPDIDKDQLKTIYALGKLAIDINKEKALSQDQNLEKTLSRA